MITGDVKIGTGVQEVNDLCRTNVCLTSVKYFGTLSVLGTLTLNCTFI